MALNYTPWNQNYTPANANYTSKSTGLPAYSPPTPNYTSTSGGAAYAPAPTPNTGGGSPAGSSSPSNPFDVPAPSGPSEQELNSLFNPILDVYNQAESNLRSQQPGLIAEAEAQAKASQGVLSSSRQNQQDLLTGQQQRVNQTGQNQIADQRRLFQELTQANQQRFGGASSAGLAASELQGREFQRSKFGIQQNVEQGLQQIDTQMQQVQREYENGLQQIEIGKQQAINDINRRFQDKLLEINARRGETEAAKGQARLEALQQLRNEAYQINVARAQFEADLRLQAQNNTSYLSNAQQELLKYGSLGVQAGDQAAGYQASGIPGVSVGSTGTTNPTLTGQIRPRDEYVGQIGSIPGSSATDPRFQNYQPFSR